MQLLYKCKSYNILSLPLLIIEILIAHLHMYHAVDTRY
uniref:Uncharacterized protein n=1 Tax=Arundo donax TaxID=35708 RepID=A0A0A9GRY9_ARUDO